MTVSLRSLFDQMYQGTYDFDDFLGEGEPTAFLYSTDNITCIADERLRAYHAFISSFILVNLDLKKEVVFSYRKNLNIADAVREHVTSKYFYQTDLRNFFSSIDSSLILKIFLENIKNMCFADSGTYLERIVELVTADGKLPPGFSTSPMISNAILFEFDEILYEYCDASNLIYTRYSDDIIISGKNKENILKAAQKIKYFLNEIYDGKFSINEEKSKFTQVGRKIKLLGMVVLPNGMLSIDIKLKKKIETLIHYYTTDSFRFLSMVDDDLKKGMQTISGYLSYANMVDENYINKLRKKYGSTIVDTFLHMKAP